MRFREFAPRKRNRNDQQVDEVLPAIGAIGGALARGAVAAGGALARGVGSLAGAAARGVGSALSGAAKTAGSQLFTQQGMQRMMGNKPGQATTPQQTTPPVQIKPGVKILHPGLGPTKIKSLQGKDAVLDTQKALGQDIRVNQNELLAVLGQGQQDPTQQVKK